MTTLPEILIVDNVKGAAEDFAALVSSKYKFNVVGCESPEEAIQIAKNCPLKVVVLDQVMPKMTGTELYKVLKKVNPNLKVLMFSGEAKADDVMEAQQLGYDATLGKSRIKELPDRVFQLYVKYEVDITHRSDFVRSLITTEYNVRSLAKIEFELLELNKVCTHKVFDEEWMTLAEVHAGQSVENETSYSFEEGLKIEESVSTKLATEYGYSSKQIVKLKAKVGGEISAKYATERIKRETTTHTKKETYVLPPQPADLEKEYVAKRKWEVAPTYTEYIALISRRCSCCGSFTPFPLKVFKQQMDFASRQTDYFSSGREEIIDTGFAKYLNS